MKKILLSSSITLLMPVCSFSFVFDTETIQNLGDVSTVILPTKTVAELDYGILKYSMPGYEWLRVNQTIELYPFTHSSSLQPQETPAPVPPQVDSLASAADATTFENDFGLHQMTSMIADLSLSEAPMSLNFSSMVNHTPGAQTYVGTSSQGAQANTQGAVIEVTMPMLAAEYPTILRVIRALESKNTQKGFYNFGDRDVFQVSQSVLRVLEDILKRRIGDGAPDKETRKAFKMFFGTLDINLFWRITDPELLINLFEQYFNNPGALRRLFILMEQFVKSLVDNRRITHNTETSLNIHILQLINHALNNSGAQVLLSEGFFNAAFFTMIFESSQVQHLMNFENTAHIQNFQIRRSKYSNLYHSIHHFLTNNGFNGGVADVFFDYLFQLLRRGCIHFIRLYGDTYTQPTLQQTNSDNLLIALDQYAGSHPESRGFVVQILTNPLLFQSASVFANTLDEQGVINFVGHLSSIMPSATGILNMNEVAAGLWGLQAYAMLGFPQDHLSCIHTQELSHHLSTLQGPATNLQAIATHLEILMNNYVLMTGQSMATGWSVKEIRHFLESFVQSKLVLKPKPKPRPRKK